MNSKIQIETHTTDIILFDVVGYSLLSDEKQFETIYLITQKLKESLNILFGQSFLKKEEVVLGFAPTGDGAYIILDHTVAGYGLFLAISLRSTLLQLKNKTNNLFEGLRTAIHFGTAIPIEDLTGKSNFVGSGLNDCARLLSIKKEIVASQKFLQDENYILISKPALNLFREKFPGKAIAGFLKVIKLEIGEEVIFKDKHNKEHQAFFVESNRHVAITPPKPTDIKERIKNLMKQYGQVKN